MAQYKGAASEGSRAMQLQKRREKEHQEAEFRMNKLKEDLRVDKMENKFAVHYDAVETQLKNSTIGLVTLDEMRAKQDDVIKEREKKIAQKKAEKEQKRKEEIEAKNAQKQLQKQQIRALSFLHEEDFDNDDDDEQEEEREEQMDKEDKKEKDEDDKMKQEVDEDDVEDDDDNNIPFKKKKIGKKNPDVDTSFLPDKEREDEENLMREQLRLEWVTQQNTLKSEEMSVTYSYWDGSGHRRSMKVTKGTSIYQFLQKCLESLRNEFGELRTVMADQLMFVKEDLILPHHYTFYDLIVTKARGKSGPLFAFHALDDIRVTQDASKEKEDTHAGKVLLRTWYERNKHIFPASRWEPYDPNKSYGKYTIADKSKT